VEDEEGDPGGKTTRGAIVQYPGTGGIVSVVEGIENQFETTGKVGDNSRIGRRIHLMNGCGSL
jgi:hypothetical protein